MKKRASGPRKAKPHSGPSCIKATKARRVKSLQEFLWSYGKGEEARRDRERFAKRVGSTLPYLVHLAWGFRKASPGLAIRIEQCTHGQVPLEDLRPDMNWGYLSKRTAMQPRAMA